MEGRKEEEKGGYGKEGRKRNWQKEGGGETADKGGWKGGEIKEGGARKNKKGG